MPLACFFKDYDYSTVAVSSRKHKYRLPFGLLLLMLHGYERIS